jgi:lysozyme
MGWVLRRWRLALWASLLAASLIASVISVPPHAAGRPKHHRHAKHHRHTKHHTRHGKKVPGIDVSTYQGRVNWARVGSTSVRFAILRSSLGNHYVDERYAKNLVGARRNGIVVGAYHFAKPGPGRWDARREADHFLRVARNAPGDLLPVLDIESSGGMTRQQLRAWATTWLGRVEHLTGLKAMIYSGNFFWRTHMGNTSYFAKRGHPLWLAHWYVASPEVPGRLWARRGWTVWQRSASGRVAGIEGDVDRNVFRGTDLGHGAIAALSVAPSEDGVITGDRLSCGPTASECARLANPGSRVMLTATPAPNAEFLRWRGACSESATSPSCTVTALGDVAVSADFGAAGVVSAGDAGQEARRAPSPAASPDCGDSCPEPAGPSVAPAAQVDSGTIDRPTIDPATSGPGPGAPAAVEPSPQAEARFESMARTEVEDGEVRYAWGRQADARAIGGSYRWERRRGGSASFAFSGGSITLLTLSGPVMGKARVAIDGTTVRMFDGYSRRVRAGITHRFRALGPGRHELTITPLGTSRPAAKGARVAVDALRWGGRIHPEARPSITTWSKAIDPSASGGTYAISDAAGADAKLWFSGTAVAVRVLRGPEMGLAAISVDGEMVRRLDLFAARRRFASIPVASGLREGAHVLRVRVLGARRPASHGTVVAFDRVVVS